MDKYILYNEKEKVFFSSFCGFDNLEEQIMVDYENKL